MEIPTGFCLKAQRCKVRATLGVRCVESINPNGVTTNFFAMANATRLAILRPCRNPSRSFTFIWSFLRKTADDSCATRKAATRSELRNPGGVVEISNPYPKVARASQPWARDAIPLGLAAALILSQAHSFALTLILSLGERRRRGNKLELRVISSLPLSRWERRT